MIEVVGGGRVHARVEVKIHRPDEPSTDVAALMAWARVQPGVDAVFHVCAHGTLVLHYDQRVGAKRLLEGALVDRIFTERARPPTLPQRLLITIGHELRGRVRLRVDGGGGDAVERLAAHVSTLDGVERARASPATRTVLAHFDPGTTSSRVILEALSASPPATWPAAAPPPKDPRIEWVKTGLSAAVMGASISGLFPLPLIIGAAALTAIPPYRRAIASLAVGRVNVDVMDATAIAVCLARSEPITATVITTLLAVGDLILERTHARARTAISRLMQLDDGEAFVVDDVLVDGEPRVRRVHPRELAPGMRIMVYPGARVPADGIVESGVLAVDEKALTGESVPKEISAGDGVMAASVAVQGQAIVRVERAGSDTVAAKIIQILEGAGAKPMTLQRNATRVADRLVLPTFATAGAAYVASGSIDRLTSVLITDFGTGIRVAIPTAALAAMIQAARAGVLVKGSQFLERLHACDTVVFDKTGTLTLGEPEVTRVVTFGAYAAGDIAAFAAAVESNQSHPIAHAIRRHAEAISAPAWAAHTASEIYRIGLGLEGRVHNHIVHIGSRRLMHDVGIDPARADATLYAMGAQGNSSLLLAVDGELAAVIGYADTPRPESRAIVERLRAGGRRRVMLLSGDSRAPVEAIARHCGIDQAIADVLPQHKADVVRALKAEGRKVAMVGDGINDAPALAVADVGISLRGGTEVALETADVVLLEGGLERLPEVFDISDGAMRRVKEVLGIVLVPNAVAIAAGAFGLLSPVMAATINNGSTIAASLHAIFPLLRNTRQSSAHDSNAR